MFNNGIWENSYSWTEYDEIDKFKEILEVLNNKSLSNEDKEEGVREIRDEYWDSYGAKILEGYKIARWGVDWKDDDSIRCFKSDVENCISNIQKRANARGFTRNDHIGLRCDQISSWKISREKEIKEIRNFKPEIINAPGDKIVRSFTVSVGPAKYGGVPVNRGCDFPDFDKYFGDAIGKKSLGKLKIQDIEDLGDWKNKKKIMIREADKAIKELNEESAEKVK